MTNIDLRLVVGHELVFNGLNLSKRIYKYVLYFGYPTVGTSNLRNTRQMPGGMGGLGIDRAITVRKGEQV